MTMKGDRRVKNNLDEIGEKKRVSETIRSRRSFVRKRGDKIGTGKNSDPERYGMVVCPRCNGTGRLVNEPDRTKKVCPQCGGFGHVRKQS
jgi:DnaJ-class molecular chaperone